MMEDIDDNIYNPFDWYAIQSKPSMKVYQLGSLNEALYEMSANENIIKLTRPEFEISRDNTLPNRNEEFYFHDSVRRVELSEMKALVDYLRVIKNYTRNNNLRRFK